MKKLILLSCSLCLLLLTNLSFSMQSEQENGVNPQLALRRNEREKAEKIMEGYPEAAKFVYKMLTKDIVSRQPGLQNDNLLPGAYQKSWNILLEGTLGIGKKTLAGSIAKYLGINSTLIRLGDMIAQYPYTHQVDRLKNQILPYLTQENNKHVFIIKDIDLLQAFRAIDEKGNDIFHDGNRLLQEYIEIAEEKNKRSRRNRLIFFATTEEPDKVSEATRKLFEPISVNNPYFARRKDLLKEMLESDRLVDSKTCISNEKLMNWLAQKTDCFTIRDLMHIVSDATSRAYSRPLIEEQKDKKQKEKNETAYLQENDLKIALKRTYPRTEAAKKYKNYSASCWLFRRKWREYTEIS